VILFQLLTGLKPFIAVDLPELMRKLLNEVPPSILSLRPELWTEIDVVVQRALARNPEDRFQTAEQFIDALNGAIEARPNDNMPPLDLTKLSKPPVKEEIAINQILNHTMAEKLSSDTIDRLGKSLARVLGPIARMLVKQASHEATDIDMLLTTLTRQIKTETEVSAFRTAAEKVLREDLGLASAQVREAISQVEVKAATDALVPLIWPVARLLVTRQATSAVGREDFYQKLADAIPNPQDRARFLQIRGNVPGGKH